MLIILLLILLYNSVYAMLPVIDVNAITQLSNEYSQLQHIDSINTPIQDYTQHLVSNSEGHYGYGNLINSLSDLKDKQYSPNTWNNALQGESTNNSEYNQLWHDYSSSHFILSKDDFEKGTTANDAKLYEQSVQSNQASGVTSTYVFNEVNQELDKIHQLSERIDQASNTKAAVDLNSRIAVELAYIQMESLKMQSIINQQVAQKSQGELQDKAEESLYRALPSTTGDE